jgi:hypothetical protein
MTDPVPTLCARKNSMYISMTPVAAAGASVLGVELISSSTERTPGVAATLTGANSPLLTLVGFLLIALALVAVAWTAKHPRR